MWILIFPQLLLIVMISCVGAIAYLLTFGLIYLALLFRVTRNYINHRNQKKVPEGMESDGISSTDNPL